MYDKWHLQARFARIVAVRTGDSGPLSVAEEELEQLHHVREKLLADKPERQDILFEDSRMVRLVWRYLGRREDAGEAEAKFDTRTVAGEVRLQEPGGWERLAGYLSEQASKGRIFIDPREFYNHYSWLIEDSPSPPEPSLLLSFYDTFVQELEFPSNPLPAIIDCAKCSQTDTDDGLPHCLLCLPKEETYQMMSPSSSLLSPPRTPGTRPLQSYFRGQRLPHPKPPPPEISEQDAARMLFTIHNEVAGERRRRPRMELHLF
jgi:hypothetical protein